MDTANTSAITTGSTVHDVQISEIWRYPVKSVGGEQLDRVPLDERGIEFDRAWGVFNPATSMILTGRREPRLLFLNASVVGGRPRITTENGIDVSADQALSDWLGYPVELRSAADGPGTFENPMNIDDETDWVQWQSGGATFHDGRSTVSLLGRESLRDWDARRFRANLIIDDAADEALAGTLHVGTSRLDVRKPIDRCIMVSRPQPGIERDISLLKTIIRERDNKLAVGAVVAHSGELAVGDRVTSD